MRGPLKILAWIVAVAVGLPLVVAALVLIAGNTSPGQRLIERVTASATGNAVRLAGLGGRFPDALHVARLEVADKSGVYLTIEDASIDWSPMRLFHEQFAVDTMSARIALLQRLPVSDSSSSGMSVPLRVSVSEFRVDRFEVGPAVLGLTEAPPCPPAMTGGGPCAPPHTPLASNITLTLSGAATIDSPTSGSGHLTVRRLDGPGQYDVAATLDAEHITATVKVDEAPHGLIANLATLPDIGGITVNARFEGPRDAVTGHAQLTAGALRANVDGTLDLVRQAADLTASAAAPAMTLRPDLRWQSVSLTARARGPFTKLDATGQLIVSSLTAAGGSVERATFDLTGNAGELHLHGALAGVHLPGNQPDLLASTPIQLEATAHLSAPDRPVDFTITHPALTAQGTAKTAGVRQVQMTLAMPDIGPFTALAGANLQGRTNVDLHVEQRDTTTSVTATGTLGITGGLAPAQSLIGETAHFDVAAAMQGDNLTLSRFQADGKSFSASAKGSVVNQRVDFTWSARFPDIAALQPTLTGSAGVTGHLTGAVDALATTVDFTSELGAPGIEASHVKAHLDASGLPNVPTAHLTARGALLGAPLDVDLAADRPNGALHVAINQLRWKSAEASGDLTMAEATTIPIGTLKFGISQLADLDPLLGRPVAGNIAGTVDATAEKVTVHVAAQGVGSAGLASVTRAAVDATITDPATNPSVEGTFVMDGVAAHGFGGSARVTVRGPANALAVQMSATSPGLLGGAAKLTGAASIDATARTMILASLQADWRQQTMRLLSPARINLATGISVDRLRIGLRQAVLEVTGSVSPTLGLAVKLRNLPADIAAMMDPSLAADGTISADAKVTGTPARPEATARITANGLRLRTGPGRALPATNVVAIAGLSGETIRLDGKLDAGTTHLAVTGSASTIVTGPLALRTNGSFDLAMLNPLLTAAGRQVRGRVDLDAGITGTTTVPNVTGTARLTDGEARDYALGAHLTALNAVVQANGPTLRITSFSGRAGAGTIGGSGSVSLAAPMQLDLHVTASNARAISSDLVTALVDADLGLRGEVGGALEASGTVHVRRADLQIPEKMPAGVAVLPVRVAGAKPAPHPGPAPADVALNLTLDAPEQIFIRGRGIDVELGGQFHIRGTATNPLPDGTLRLRQGTVSVVGQTLTFASGTIDFVGADVTNPSLNLVTAPTGGTIAATLTVMGTAREPKIVLASAQGLPQDEILAQLLFQRSIGSLSPFEIAQVAAALASLSGATSGLGDPLADMRKSLGLDRLSIGAAGSNGGPTVEAGRYLRRGVYLGVKQSATGSGTQATVQIDIAKGLKLETTAGSGSTNATGASSGGDAASVGLTYQFEY